MAAQPTRKRKQALPRGRHSLPREAVVQSQRERTLAAMLEVVADKGYPVARIADAIAVAGVSRKTYYELFKDKEDCFLAAYDDAAERILDAFDRGYEEVPDEHWIVRIRHGFAAMLDELVADPAAARVWAVEILAAGPAALERRDAALRRLTDRIDEGREESGGELPEIASLAIVGGIQELLYTESLHGSAAQLPTRLPEIVYWVAQPFLGEARAAAERERTLAWMAERSAVRSGR